MAIDIINLQIDATGSADRPAIVAYGNPGWMDNDPLKPKKDVPGGGDGPKHDPNEGGKPSQPGEKDGKNSNTPDLNPYLVLALSKQVCAAGGGSPLLVSVSGTNNNGTSIAINGDVDQSLDGCTAKMRAPGITPELITEYYISVRKAGTQPSNPAIAWTDAITTQLITSQTVPNTTCVPTDIPIKGYDNASIGNTLKSQACDPHTQSLLNQQESIARHGMAQGGKQLPSPHARRPM